VTTQQIESETERASPSAPADPIRRRWWPDAVVLAVAAAVLRIPALLAPTNLGYDDGGYGLAAIAMREGYAPFRDIFSPQGPLFLPLVHAFDWLGFRTMDAPRLLSVAAGVTTTVAVYAAGREITDRGRALLAGALTASSGVLLWTTGPLTGDGPGAALATGAVAVALAYRRSPSRGKAVAIMLLAGAAVAVKSLLVGPAVLVAWVLVATRRRWFDALLVPLGAGAVVVLAALPWGVGHVLDDYVRYHLGKTGARTPGANIDKIVTTFFRRDLPLVVIGALGAVSAVVARVLHRHRSPQGDRTDGPWWERAVARERIVWWWAATVVALLVVQEPMFRNHLAALVAPLALLVACFRPSWRVVAVAAIVTVPFQVATLRPLALPDGYSGREARIVERLRTLPEDAWALSDQPGLVWRAGLGTDPYFVDPSALRIGLDVPSIAVTEDRIVEAARRPRTCAVVITAHARFGHFTGLPARLERLDYRLADDFGSGLGVWTRATPRCR
jgi:hypothetical protein